MEHVVVENNGQISHMHGHGHGHVHADGEIVIDGENEEYVKDLTNNVSNRIAFIDCFAGAAGDMLLGALFDCGLNEKNWTDKMKSMEEISDQWEIQVQRKRMSGGMIVAHKVDVIVTKKQTHHRNLETIQSLIDSGKYLPETVKDQAKKAFRMLAECEAKIHGTSIEKIHFHEVGAIDSIIDTIGVFLGFNMLGVDQAFCSSLPIAHQGTVKTEHGLLPVPAPATMKLMQNHFICHQAPQVMRGELLTPTAASILRTFVPSENAGKMPQSWKIEQVGMGAGTRNPEEYPNIVRVMIGTNPSISNRESLIVLETNVDDMTPEIAGACMETLISDEAILDVWFTNIQMKKHRPALKISLLCKANDQMRAKALLFRHTSTFGIRSFLVDRDALTRKFETVETKFGAVRIKHGILPDTGVTIQSSPEFEDCKKLAKSHNVPISKVFQAALTNMQLI